MLQPNQNTGVLEQPIGATDYIQDQSTAIAYQEVNPSGDWTGFLPVNESQIGLYGDTFACVTFSALNCLETLFKFISKPKNLSDRFTAKMSGTTRSGNYLQAVANSIRHDGVVDEGIWSWDYRGNNPPFTWEKFYEEIPADIQKVGTLFTQEYETQYEWVPTDLASLKKALKQAPLQIVTKVCAGWDNPPVNGCGLGSGHATMLYKIDDEGFHIFDHYDPYRKLLKPDYVIGYAMKHIIKPKQATKPMLQIAENTLVQLIEGTGGFGMYANGKLYVDDTALLLASVFVRNRGKLDGKAVAIKQADWDALPKFNLKNQPL